MKSSIVKIVDPVNVLKKFKQSCSRAYNLAGMGKSAQVAFLTQPWVGVVNR